MEVRIETWPSRFFRHQTGGWNICFGEDTTFHVQDNIIKTWKEGTLPKVIEGYDRKDVFNADKSGLFFKNLPSKTITMAGERCSGGKKSNERVTILPIANWEGTEKETLIVIGKSAKPRCFKNVSTLPVT